MSASSSTKLQVALGVLVSAVILAIPFQTWVPSALTRIEAVAVVGNTWSVWLLARNHPLGWWIGLVAVVAYGWMFYGDRLYADFGLQGFYLVTSLQAIWIWLRGGAGRTERPVTHLPRVLWIPTFAVAVGTTFGLRELLVRVNGAAPVLDAVTTVMSLVAQVLLMFRFVESWHFWVAVDTVYVPLYWSRGFKLTAATYVLFWFLALQGLLEFRKLAREARK